MEISLIIAVAGVVIGLTGIGLAIWQKLRIDKLTKLSGKDLESEFAKVVEDVAQNGQKVEELQRLVTEFTQRAESATQKVALERYDAYEDVGGAQSFVLVMLDAKNTGVLVNVIHGRTSTRVYGKKVVEGKVDATLSEEEEKALNSLV